jgi:hypothetical protein
VTAGIFGNRLNRRKKQEKSSSLVECLLTVYSHLDPCVVSSLENSPVSHVPEKHVLTYMCHSAIESSVDTLAVPQHHAIEDALVHKCYSLIGTIIFLFYLIINI